MTTHNGRITHLDANQVFVFGANLQGFHGAGSAGYATFNEPGNVWRKHGYADLPKGSQGKWNRKGLLGGQRGTKGCSYALVTVTRAGAKRSITPSQMIQNIEEFYGFVDAHPDREFLVAQSAGKGLNGYEAIEMARFFYVAGKGDIPENVVFQDTFAELLNNPSPAWH